MNFLTLIIENSTILPFRFPSNKFMCFYCGLLIDECIVLRQHTMVEHEAANLGSVMTLWNIKTVKLDVSEITCKRCLKRLDNLEEFLTHAKTVHNLVFNKEVTKTMFCFKLQDDPLRCMECSEEFKFFGPLLKHVHKLHNKYNKFLCEICGQSFVTLQNVTNHTKLCHEKKECGICQERFNTVYALTNHELVVHNKQKLKCPQCPEVLNSGYLKKRHLALAHNVQSCQFKCEDCDKVFTVRSRLFDHRARVHLKVKSVECEICGFKVFNKDMLKRHMIKHDDSRPFECQYCKKAFQRKKTLVWHTRIHTNDRRHACSQCGKTFVQLTSLKVHHKVHHPTVEEPSWN